MNLKNKLLDVKKPALYFGKYKERKIVIMKNHHKITKSQRQALKLSKIRLHQQITDVKISKKLHKIIRRKTIVNPQLLDLPIIKKGIKNQVQSLEKTFFQIKHKYADHKSDVNKLIYNKAKKVLNHEKQIEKSEIHQIVKLNNKPKGQVHVALQNGIAIKVNNLYKYYPTKGFIKEALSNINLEFKIGSFNVILGTSGSGKTTLLNMISGLDRATSGEVIVNDINIQALNDRETTLFRREKIGFVFQSYNLLSSLNVRDNIEIGRSLQNDGNKRQDIDILLKKMMMIDQDKKMIYELSGGQQQRVSIARALAKAPQILFGDEPTGALDQITSKKIFEIFSNINHRQATTIIIVTHNPNIAKIANQVIKIKDGQVETVYENKHPHKVAEL